MEKIKLGYEINTAEEVFVRPCHLIITGVTQLSGKTTTLEALIKRSKLKAIVFKTKIGEKSFTDSITIAPFFRDRSDYEFVKSLIEAYSKEKLSFEKGTLMTLCKGSKDLVEIKRRVDDKLAEGKLRGLKEEIYVKLQHYLENLIPQIKYANFSSVLNLREGINVMDLESYSEEAQSLIMESVCSEVLKKERDVIIVIPEAWKFIPQKHNNPCKRAVESLIRQGATNNNFIWMDSQDMAGVDKIPLKQISTWILGYQSERNEVKHTIDQIPLPKKSKPTTEQIMTLKKGHFYLASYDGVVNVYVQPIWMANDEEARAIARGDTDVESTPKPRIIDSVPINPNEKITFQPYDNLEKQLRNQIIEFKQELYTTIEKLKKEIKEELLQEIKSNQPIVDYTIDYNKIITEAVKRMPKSKGSNQVVSINYDTEIPEECNMILQKLGGMCKTVYETLLKHREGLTKTQISLMSGYSLNSGSFSNAMSKLNSMKLIKKENDAYKVVLK